MKSGVKAVLYVYGIAKKDNELDLNIKGFGTENISLVDFDDIAAVVSIVGDEFSQEAIDKNVKDMKWVAKNATLHENVVESVMEKTTIIPMTFCTIFKNEESVKKMLEENYSKFKENLERLANKIEVGVKVYFDAGPLKQELKKELPEIKKLEEEAKKQSSGVAYFTEQKIDILLKEGVRNKIIDFSKEIFKKLKPLAENAKESELWNKKATGRDMLLNSVFLIKKSDFDQFKKNMERINLEYKNLEFEIAGPFPPYNFVD